MGGTNPGKYYLTGAEASVALQDVFKNEREFCDYIELNLDLFCKDDLGFELERYRREWPVIKNAPKTIGRRVDFLLQTVCGKNIIVECKVVGEGSSESARAIGQILSYIQIMTDQGAFVDLAVLLTNKVCNTTAAIIKNYNLPIKYICLDKSQSLILQLEPSAHVN